MPKTETTLQVFVASPGDLQTERNILSEIIEELNLVTGPQHSVKLALLRWETHATPGFGADAQDVINQQIDEPYDIFVGMMWTRFGTPTGRAASGTQEEFDRAYARFQQDPNAVDIMFYFKTAPVSPMSLDPEQIAAVIGFKKRVQTLGGLYSQFASSEDFRTQVRLHLTRSIQKWSKRLATTAVSTPTTMVSVSSPGDIVPSAAETAPSVKLDDAEDGYLDLLDKSEFASNQCGESLEKLSSASKELATRFNERTEEVNELKKDGGVLARPAARRVTDRAAADLDNYTYRTNAELPLFSEAFATMLDSIGKAAAIVVESGSDADEQLRNAVTQLADLKSSIDFARSQGLDFRETVAKLPRTTAVFNKSRRNALVALDRLLDEMRKGIDRASELEHFLKGLIPPDGNPVN